MLANVLIYLLVLTCCVSFTESQYTPCLISVPQNGWLQPKSGRVNVGKTVKVYCNHGYTLVGSAKLRCTRNGILPKNYHFQCKPTIPPPPACPICTKAVCHGGSKCDSFPDAKCFTRECSCSPVYVLEHEYYTEEDCKIDLNGPYPCPICIPVPCGTQNTCPNIQGAECKSRFCNCDSIFVTGDAVLSNEDCKPKPPKACPMCAPCENQSCPRYPGTTCVIQECSCTPLFVKNNAYYTQEQCNPDVPKVCAGCLPGKIPCGEQDTCPAVDGAQCKHHYCGCGSIFVKNNVVIPKENCRCPRCLVYSCAIEKCKLFPDAKCISASCGCSVSHYELNGIKITKEQCNGCPLNGVKCTVDPCKYANCPVYPNAECRQDYCDGSCQYSFFFKGKKISYDECRGCPTESFNCYSPCLFESCAVFPDAECRPNSCGGVCTYDFFVNDKKVKCGTGKCPHVRITSPCKDECLNDFDCSLEQRCCGNGCNRMCLDGLPPPAPCSPQEPQPLCTRNPCEKPCFGKQKAQCQLNTCGGCFADYYELGVKIPHRTCEIPTCRRLCPQDSCADHMCKGVPGRKCVPDSCNNCAPRFYDTNDFRITPHRCSLCADGKPPSVRCANNPCNGKSCAADFNAKCMADYCKGCNSYDFYNGNGKLLNKNACEPPPPPPPPVPSCSYLESGNYCGSDLCYSNDDCTFLEYCCFNGCANICRD